MQHNFASEGVQLDHSEGQMLGLKREASAELVGPYAVIVRIALGDATSLDLAQKTGVQGALRLVAIKRLRDAYAQQPEWTQLLLDEARLSAGMRHPNLVRVLDVGTDAGCYLVMEYIEGADLELLLRQAGRERHARYVVPPIVDALLGLEALHTARDALGEALSMVHQAPRARHILVGIDGLSRITDLSQVCARGLIPSSLRSARLQVAAMAPEQLLTPDRVDARTDVFVMGITLWEALTGERLFESDAPEVTRRSVLERRILCPSEVGLRPPRCFDAICMRALQRSPEQRFESAGAMAQALREVAVNAGLYATAGELGHWVRALAGGELLKRRQAIGADAPSIEMALDELADTTADLAASRAALAAELQAARPAPAPIAPETSRVARAMTVSVAAPPSASRPAARRYPAGAATLLGVSPVPVSASAPSREPAAAPGVRAEYGGAAQRAVPSSRVTHDGGAHDPSSRPLRAGATLPESTRSREPAAHAPEVAGRSGARGTPYAPPPASTPPMGVLPPGAGTILQAGPPPPSPSRGSALRLPAAGYDERESYVTRRSVAASPPDDAYVRRSREAEFDPSTDSLRPFSRGAHIEPPDWDEPPSSGGRGLAILSLVLVGIIVVAGVVGFRQWSRENTEGPRAKPNASARPASDDADTPAAKVGERRQPSRPTGGSQPSAEPSTERAATGGLKTSPVPTAAPKPVERASPGALSGSVGGVDPAAPEAPTTRPVPPWKRRIPLEPTRASTPSARMAGSGVASDRTSSARGITDSARVPADGMATDRTPPANATFPSSAAPARVPGGQNEPPGLPSNPYE